MFELTAPSPMTSPYTPAGGSNMPTTMPQPPKLGTPIPGVTGGLPANAGLNVFDNPLSKPLQSQAPQEAAQGLQQYGRGQDTMLVHMTPEEVNSLQGLAMAHGGSLTINPDTGLPEAGFLSKLLPLIAGIGLNFILPGSGGLVGALGGKAATAGLITGVGTTAITGDLNKGLMAGLGAFGGASLAGGIKGAISGAAPGGAASTAAPAATAGGTSGAVAGGLTATPAQIAASSAPGVAAPAVKTGISGFAQGFGNTAKGIPLTGGAPATGFLAKAAPALAGMGVINALQPTPSQPKATKEEPGSSQYTSAPRERIAPRAQLLENAAFDPTRFDSSEQQWFTPTRPDVIGPQGQVFLPGSSDTTAARSSMPSFLQRNAAIGGLGSGFSSPIWDDPKRFRAAEGGEVPEFHMESGGHVFPAKAVAAYGNFDTAAGQRKLSGLGAIPIKGPGDGVSDSIPARIDGEAPARVASGEVYFPPRAVKRLGGTEKLYAMMRKAEKAANRAKSGEKVKGLA